MIKKYQILIFLIFPLVSCNQKQNNSSKKDFKVVTTTSIVNDLVKDIGKDAILVENLMGPGIDPHLYKASERDVNLLSGADLIIYNGLHLEGKLVDVFQKMRNKKTIALSDTIPVENLIVSGQFESNYDPHIWFDIENWKKAAWYVSKQLSILDTTNKDFYFKNALETVKKYDSVQNQIKGLVMELPLEKRILITAHDAFNYFGKAYEFEVIGLQGLSTATEAGVKDVQDLAKLIYNKKINAIFVETSVPRRTIEALEKSVLSKGHIVKIGGTLYSDALGNLDTPEGNYCGMMIYNVQTIVNSLK